MNGEIGPMFGRGIDAPKVELTFI